MAENPERNPSQKGQENNVTREEFEMLQRLVYTHGDDIKVLQRELKQIGYDITKIQVAVSPFESKTDLILSKIDDMREWTEKDIQRFSGDLERFKRETDERLEEQKNHINTLDISERQTSILSFWLTSEGIITAFVSGGTAIVVALMGLFS